MQEVENLLKLIWWDQVKDYTTRKARLYDLKFWMMELKNKSLSELNKKYKWTYKWEEIKKYADLIVNWWGGKHTYTRVRALSYIIGELSE